MTLDACGHRTESHQWVHSHVFVLSNGKWHYFLFRLHAIYFDYCVCWSGCWTADACHDIVEVVDNIKKHDTRERCVHYLRSRVICVTHSCNNGYWLVTCQRLPHSFVSSNWQKVCDAFASSNQPQLATDTLVWHYYSRLFLIKHRTKYKVVACHATAPQHLR